MFTRNGHLFPTLDTRWMDSAACQGMGDLFFPNCDGGARYDQARAVCADCPVRTECLNWALEVGEPAGMWGGQTPDERSRRPRCPVAYVSFAPVLDRFPWATLDEIAGLVGVTQRAVIRWKNTGQVTTRRAELIADALGLHPVHIWGAEWITATHRPSPAPLVSAGGAVR